MIFRAIVDNILKQKGNYKFLSFNVKLKVKEAHFYFSRMKNNNSNAKIIKITG